MASSAAVPGENIEQVSECSLHILKEKDLYDKIEGFVSDACIFTTFRSCTGGSSPVSDKRGKLVDDSIAIVEYILSISLDSSSKFVDSIIRVLDGRGVQARKKALISECDIEEDTIFLEYNICLMLSVIKLGKESGGNWDWDFIDRGWNRFPDFSKFDFELQKLFCLDICFRFFCAVLHQYKELSCPEDEEYREFLKQFVENIIKPLWDLLKYRLHRSAYEESLCSTTDSIYRSNRCFYELLCFYSRLYILCKEGIIDGNEISCTCFDLKRCFKRFGLDMKGNLSADKLNYFYCEILRGRNCIIIYGREDCNIKMLRSSLRMNLLQDMQLLLGCFYVFRGDTLFIDVEEVPEYVSDVLESCYHISTGALSVNIGHTPQAVCNVLERIDYTQEKGCSIKGRCLFTRIAGDDYGMCRNDSITYLFLQALLYNKGHRGKIVSDCIREVSSEELQFFEGRGDDEVYTLLVGGGDYRKAIFCDNNDAKAYNIATQVSDENCFSR